MIPPGTGPLRTGSTPLTDKQLGNLMRLFEKYSDDTPVPYPDEPELTWEQVAMILNAMTKWMNLYGIKYIQQYGRGTGHFAKAYGDVDYEQMVRDHYHIQIHKSRLLGFMLLENRQPFPEPPPTYMAGGDYEAADRKAAGLPWVRGAINWATGTRWAEQLWEEE